MDLDAQIYMLFHLKNQDDKFPLGRFFIDHAKIMHPVIRGEELQGRSRLEVGTQGRCFDNAQRLLMHDLTRYVYCEGVVSISQMGFPIEHAWVYDRIEDEYIDTTLQLPPHVECVYVGLAIPLSLYLKCQQNWKGSVMDTLWRGLVMDENEIQSARQMLLSANE